VLAGHAAYGLAHRFVKRTTASKLAGEQVSQALPTRDCSKIPTCMQRMCTHTMHCMQSHHTCSSCRSCSVSGIRQARINSTTVLLPPAAPPPDPAAAAAAAVPALASPGPQPSESELSSSSGVMPRLPRPPRPPRPLPPRLPRDLLPRPRPRMVRDGGGAGGGCCCR
jgi:hypothetical protein